MEPRPDRDAFHQLRDGPAEARYVSVELQYLPHSCMEMVRQKSSDFHSFPTLKTYRKGHFFEERPCPAIPN